MTEPTAGTAAAEDKLDFKKILPIFVIVLIDLLGLTVIVPLLPLYAASYGANAFMVGLLGATYPVAQFVAAPVLGRLSDRFGRKPVLLVSQVGTLAGFLLLANAASLALFFLSRLIDGLSGANISTAQAVISDSTTEKTRTQGLGLIGAAFGLGFILGPMISFAALAASGNNLHVPAYIAAGLSFISILLTWRLLKETHPAHTGQAGGKAQTTSGFSLAALGQALRHPGLGLLLALMFAQQLAFGGFEQLLSVFTLDRLGLNASSNALVFIFVGVIVVAVQGYFIGRWSKRFGDPWLVRVGLAALAVGLILTAVTPRQPPPWYSRAELQAQLTGSDPSLPGATPPARELQFDLPPDDQRGWLGLAWLLAAMVPAAIGGGILQPAINSLITRQVSAVDVGGTLGLSAAMLGAANAIAPVAMGTAFQLVGARAPFLLGGLLLGVLWLLSLRRLPQPQPA